VIQDVDAALRRLLIEKVPLPVDRFLVKFDVPDRETWKPPSTKVSINVYLYDIRENHDLASPVWYEEMAPDGTIVRERPAARLDLFYVVSAWSGAKEPDAREEHEALSNILRTLLYYPTLPPWVLGGALVGQRPPLPTLVAQLDGLPHPPAEFWSALNNRLRPSISLVVTIALKPAAYLEGPDVLFPVESGTLAVGVSAGDVLRVEVRPALAIERAAGTEVFAVTTQATAATLEAPLLADASELIVADGTKIRANEWVLVSDAAGEAVRPLVDGRSGVSTIRIAPPLRSPHAATVQVLELTAEMTSDNLTKLVLEADAAANAPSIRAIDGTAIPAGSWILIDDGPERTEFVQLQGAPGAGTPTTLMLVEPTRFAHRAGRPLLPALVGAVLAQLAEDANQLGTSATLSAAPPVGTRVKIGRGEETEFARIAGLPAGPLPAPVPVAPALRKNHLNQPAKAAVRPVLPGASIGKLARRAEADTAEIVVAGPSTLRPGDVLRLGGAASDAFHEIVAVVAELGAVQEPTEDFHVVGAWITDDADPPAAVAGAQVVLAQLDAAANEVQWWAGATDAEGHVIFSGLQAGRYRLRIQAPGFQQTATQVRVPSVTAREYEVQLTPS
jgi:hypothetical protein